jgi:hypothetical protein
VDRNEIPKRSLEVIVKNDVSFFSRAKTTMGRVSLIFKIWLSNAYVVRMENALKRV